MNVLIYRTTGRVRSVLTSKLVADVPVEELPDDLDAFADEHGGDVVEVQWAD